jgi:hypothetical protein
MEENFGNELPVAVLTHNYVANTNGPAPHHSNASSAQTIGTWVKSANGLNHFWWSRPRVYQIRHCQRRTELKQVLHSGFLKDASVVLDCIVPGVSESLDNTVFPTRLQLQQTFTCQLLYTRLLFMANRFCKRSSKKRRTQICAIPRGMGRLCRVEPCWAYNMKPFGPHVYDQGHLFGARYLQSGAFAATRPFHKEGGDEITVPLQLRRKVQGCMRFRPPEIKLVCPLVLCVVCHHRLL